MRKLFAFGTAAIVCATSSAGTNWPHWRGPHDNGSTETGDYPVKWDAASNLLWKVSLPGKGCSTPIVWERQIFLTAPAQGEDAVLAFDWSGKLLWQTKLGSERSGKNAHGSGSNPSPATDGHSVFVFFKSGHFAALDFSGKVLWQTDLVQRFGRDTLYWDYGASPVLSENDVIIARLHHGDSYVAAFDKASGVLHWKVARNYQTATEGDHGYASPIVIREHGKEALLVWGSEHLTAHETSNGKIIWSCGDFNPKAVSYWPPIVTPMIAGDIVVVSSGRGSQVHGIQLGGAGDVTASHRRWARSDTGSFVTTPAEYKGRIYLLRDHGPDRGTVECLDPVTGQTVWRAELPKSSAEFYASPVVANGKLYAAREDGVVFVAQVEDKFELLGQNSMGESIVASPVPLADRLLVRGEKHLFCVGGK